MPCVRGSKHGSTREIVEVVVEELRKSDISVDLREPGEVDGITGYDADVLGSAIYMGELVA